MLLRAKGKEGVGGEEIPHLEEKKKRRRRPPSPLHSLHCHFKILPDCPLFAAIPTSPFFVRFIGGRPPFGTRKGVEGRETLWFRQQLPPSLLLHTCRGKREKRTLPRPRSGRGGERGVKEGQLFPATTKSQKLFAFRDFAIEQKSCFLQVGTEQKRALLLLTLS